MSCPKEPPREEPTVLMAAQTRLLEEQSRQIETLRAEIAESRDRNC